MTTTIAPAPAVRGSTPPALIISDRDHERLARTIDGREHELARLAGELTRARVVPASALPGDVVTMGSRVVYEDTTTAARRTITVVFPDEADVAAGRVSVLAPIGSALLGLRVGDAIDWPLPNRATRLRVVSLEHQER